MKLTRCLYSLPQVVILLHPFKPFGPYKKTQETIWREAVDLAKIVRHTKSMNLGSDSTLLPIVVCAAHLSSGNKNLVV